MNISAKLTQTVTLIPSSVRDAYGALTYGSPYQRVYCCFIAASKQRVMNDKGEVITADYEMYVNTPWPEIGWKVSNAKGVDGSAILSSGTIVRVQAFHHPRLGRLLCQALITLEA